MRAMRNDAEVALQEDLVACDGQHLRWLEVWRDGRIVHDQPSAMRTTSTPVSMLSVPARRSRSQRETEARQC